MTGGDVLETFDTVALGMHLRRRSTLLLSGAGIAAALLHAATRFPLHLPGHEGLEWMAILMLARPASPRSLGRECRRPGGGSPGGGAEH